MYKSDVNYINVAAFYGIQTIWSLHHFFDCVLPFQIVLKSTNRHLISYLFCEKRFGYNLHNYKF